MQSVQQERWTTTSTPPRRASLAQPRDCMCHPTPPATAAPILVCQERLTEISTRARCVRHALLARTFIFGESMGTATATCVVLGLSTETPTPQQHARRVRMGRMCHPDRRAAAVCLTAIQATSTTTTTRRRRVYSAQGGDCMCRRTQQVAAVPSLVYQERLTGISTRARCVQHALLARTFIFGESMGTAAAIRVVLGLSTETPTPQQHARRVAPGRLSPPDQLVAAQLFSVFLARPTRTTAARRLA